MSLLMFLLARLREPSTYAGLGAVLAAGGVHVDNATLQALIQVSIAAAGLGAILLPEIAHGGSKAPAA